MKRSQLILLAAAVFFTVLCCSSTRATAGTFVVDSTGDQNDSNPGNGTCATSTGDCTLRAAIAESNAHSGKDTIHFHIGSGIKTITPNNSLPTITDPVTIDGTTQPGCTKYPCIVLNGNNSGPAGVGLSITAGSTTIKGLVINRFPNQGIFMKTKGSNKITGNYVGTSTDGTTARGNYIGVEIEGGSSNNIIGGTTSADRNLISGNVNTGVSILETGTDNNIVEGNYIGTDVTGKKNLGNGGNGVEIITHASNNTIGGTGAGAGNKIGFNSYNGVDIGFDASETANGNAILGNTITSDSILGIDLGFDGVTANDTNDADTGPNNLQNYPTITSAKSSTQKISAQLQSAAHTTFTIEFFSSPKCDASGYGEGRTFLGRTTATTDSSGNVTFSFTATTAFSAGGKIKATATDPGNNTSEFGKCVTAS